jgi:hypothetical protein
MPYTHYAIALMNRNDLPPVFVIFCYTGSPGFRRAIRGFGAGAGVGASWVHCSQAFDKVAAAPKAADSSAAVATAAKK